MKKSSKLIVGIITATLFFTTEANSQTTPSHAFLLSLGIDSGLPTGNSSVYNAYTLGGDIRLQYGLSNNFALTLTTGGYHFFPKKMPGSNDRYASYGIGPIKAGIKWFFTQHLYFGTEAGVGVEVTEHDGFGQKKLLLSPELGYADKRWDFAVRYESYSGQGNDYGQVALRLGYGFRL